MIERFIFLLKTDRRTQLIALAVLIGIIIIIVLFFSGSKKDVPDEVNVADQENHIGIDFEEVEDEYFLERADDGSYIAYIIKDYDKTKEELESALIRDGKVEDASEIKWYDLTDAYEKEMRQQQDVLLEQEELQEHMEQ